MNQRGFSLVEVLIASVILFAAVGLAVVAFQSSVKSVQSAESTAEVLAPLPILLDAIELKLRDVPAQPYQEQGNILGVSYQWLAEPKEFYAPKARFDPDIANFVTYPERFVIYQVRITVSKEGRSRTMQYEKLGWMPAMPADLGKQ